MTIGLGAIGASAIGVETSSASTEIAMPSYDLLSIASLVRDELGQRLDIPGSVLTLRINMAYQDVANDARHALLESIQTSSTESGVSRYTLPTNFGNIVSVAMHWSWSTNTNATPSYATLRQISPIRADALGDLPGGTPTSFYFWRDSLHLWPSPNSAYTLTLRYIAEAEDMTSALSVPSIATAYRYAIVLKAEAYTLRYLRDYDGADAADNAYLQYMAKTRFAEARRQSDEGRIGFAVVQDTPPRLMDSGRYFSATEKDRW